MIGTKVDFMNKKIAYIEDCDIDFMQMNRLTGFEMTRFTTLSQFMNQDIHYDIVISDVILPDFNASLFFDLADKVYGQNGVLVFYSGCKQPDNIAIKNDGWFVKGSKDQSIVDFLKKELK